MKSKWEEYQICLERGHVPDGTSYSDASGEHHTCRYCGTTWYEETVCHYSNEPTEEENE
jgi:hypothetical protein